MTAQGDVELFAKQLSADVSLQLKALNLYTLTPYAGTYIGREIDKGQLFLELDYQIKNNALMADNQLLLDQLTFGEKVNSKQAVKLPIGLAVSLLKNPKGEIKIDLPIKGDLSDQEFNYGKALLGSLKNLIVKAVASPFTLLAGIAGSKNDLSYISFAAGSSELDSANQEKIASLQAALLQRPKLKLDVIGCYSQTLDAAAVLSQTGQTASIEQLETLAQLRGNAIVEALLHNADVLAERIASSKPAALDAKAILACQLSVR